MPQPTYLINLGDADQRRTRMARQLEEQGMDFERVGCDFRHTSRRSIEKWFVQHIPAARPGASSLSGAELGCWASHLTAWTRIARSGASAGTVLEDDVLLSSAFRRAVETLEADLGGFDVVYLGTSTRTLSARRPTHVGGLAIHKPVGLVVNTWSYVIGAAWIRTLLAQPSFAVTQPIDHFLGGRGRVVRPRIGVLQPSCVEEDPATASASQIAPHTWRMDRMRLVEAGRRKFLASRGGDWVQRVCRWL